MLQNGRVWLVRLLHEVGMGIENSYVEVCFLIPSSKKPLHGYYVKACSRLSDKGFFPVTFPVIDHVKMILKVTCTVVG